MSSRGVPDHVGSAAETIEPAPNRELGSIEPEVDRPERTTRTGLFPFYAAHGVGRIALYGHEARALTDALRALESIYEGETVLLPSLTPGTLAEAVRVAGLVPRFYPLTDDLRPTEEVAEWFDETVLAAVIAHPFGRLQPDESIDSFADRCVDHGAGLIEDATRAALSTHDGDAVGLTGDVGLLAFSPFFRVPNGAALVPGAGIRSEALRNASVEHRFTSDDVRYSLSTVFRATAAAPVVSSLSRTLSPVRSHPRETERAPAYASTDVAMSKLSRMLLDHVDPEWCVGARRANATAWRWHLADVEGVSPLFDASTRGCCPSALPVIVENGRAAGRLREAWPRLVPAVLEGDAYETERALAARTRLLPVDQSIDPETVEAVGRTWFGER
ncbi:DegT/DnrJ/EryC1/StrS family aminotransferase [Natronorarus salvus]|uniref:DegT/DnrJ/EryC1/StrS family aminotransferase n=1 Tax=Natronorarus salvus TaxID=3117733 RepID=UPI002F26841F